MCVLQPVYHCFHRAFLCLQPPCSSKNDSLLIYSRHSLILKVLVLRSAVSHRRVCVSVVVCFRCIVYHLETRMRKDVCFGVIALTWVMSAVLASPLAIFREYDSFTLEPGHTIQVLHTHTHTHL